MNLETWLALLDRLGFQAARLLLSVLWQSSIVLVAAGLMAYALRRRQAAVRHALWVSAVLLAPLLPVLGWMATNLEAPQAQLPLMPAYSAPAAVTAPAPVPAAPAPADVAPPVPPAAPSLLAYPWALALSAYASGAVVLFALVAVGRLRMHRWIRYGRVVTDSRVLGTFRAVRARLGLAARDVTVVENTDVPGPMTVGDRHPVVLLPAGFTENTSAEELEAVAVHELAHVKRHDAAVLALLSLVRAALYFHPLIWLACRQVARLAELACDDAVLEITGEPVSYARLLARLAEELPRRALVTELAAGIVISRGAFLRRVEAILSDRRDRIRRLSRAALAVTVIAASVSVALALALPLGEQTAMQAPKVDTPPTTPWGPAVEGVQVHLRAATTTLRAGEIPSLAVGVRNRGTRDLEWALAPECVELELDGQWYDGGRNRHYNVEHVAMGPGRQYDGYPFLQISDYRRWRSKDGDKPLAFTAGRHALRVAALLKPTDGGKPFRVVSNPLEITIRPDESPAGARSDSRSADGLVLEAAEGRVRLKSGENVVEAERIVLEPAGGRITAEGRAAPTVGPAPVSAASAPPTHILVKAHVLKIPAKAEKRALDTLARFGARASKGDDTAVKADNAHVLLSKDRTTALMKDLQRITSVVVVTAPKVMLLDGERGHVWIGQRITAPLPLVNHVLYPKVRMPTEIDVGVGLGIRCTAAEDGGTITVRAVPEIWRLVDLTDLPVVEKARTETTAPVPVGRTLLLDVPASRFGRFRATGVRRTKDFETGKRTEEVVWEPAGPATASERILVFITPTITRRPWNEPPEVPSFSP